MTELGNTLLAWLGDGLGTREDPVPHATAAANLTTLMDVARRGAGIVWIGTPDAPVALAHGSALATLDAAPASSPNEARP